MLHIVNYYQYDLLKIFYNLFYQGIRERYKNENKKYIYCINNIIYLFKQ